jgi:uncharacterized protein YodC (DUF2158 family)
MAGEFKAGDVVRLKSGGPAMTIEEIGRYGVSKTEGAKCVWFEGTKPKEEVFALLTLAKA